MTSIARSRLFAHPIRKGGVALVAVAVLAPLSIVLYQSFLDGPFFMPSARFSLRAFRYVLTDPEFHAALGNSLLVATGMVLIALPLGAALAFLMTRTDLPGRRWLEPILLFPMFVSSIIFAFGYVVSVGPVGFLSVWVSDVLGYVPWTIYSIPSIVVIAGLTHVPQIYVYVSTALRNVNPEVEEAARVMGAGMWRTAFTVSLPLVRPALVFSGFLMFLVGIELFGLVLVLAASGREAVLTSYLYRLTNLFGRPSYEVMAVVTLVLILLTAPMVLLQRRFIKASAHYATVRGRGIAVRPLPLGAWRWVAFALVMLWLFVAVVLPIGGILLRAFVSSWGVGVSIPEVLTLDNFRSLFDSPNLTGAVVNTVTLATVGGAAAVVVYAAVALIPHRWQSSGATALDYLVLVPRALPGLVAGLLFLWLFLFVPVLSPLRSNLVGIWIAYLIVWLAYGMRSISTSLHQIGPELEEAARVTGASQARATRDVTLPLVRFGLVSSWVLIFIAFCREYSTGFYLLGPSTQVIGSLLITLFVGGELRIIAALSAINILLIGAGVFIALRMGARVHD